MRLAVVIAVLAAVSLLVACPAAEEDPGRGVRETFAQAMEYIRAGEYDKVWTLYSVEFREKIASDHRTQKDGIRKALAEQAYDVEAWTLRQANMTPDQYLAASSREILAKVLEVNRERVLKSRIVGEILVEGDIAHVGIQLGDEGEPASFRFIHRNGRWLYHERDFMPPK